MGKGYIKDEEMFTLESFHSRALQGIDHSVGKMSTVQMERKDISISSSMLCRIFALTSGVDYPSLYSVSKKQTLKAANKWHFVKTKTFPTETHFLILSIPSVSPLDLFFLSPQYFGCLTVGCLAIIKEFYHLCPRKECLRVETWRSE